MERCSRVLCFPVYVQSSKNPRACAQILPWHAQLKRLTIADYSSESSLCVEGLTTCQRATAGNSTTLYSQMCFTSPKAMLRYIRNAHGELTRNLPLTSSTS